MNTLEELEAKKQKFLTPLFSLSDKLPALFIAKVHDPTIKMRIQLILHHFPPALEFIRDLIAQQIASKEFASLRPTLVQQETHVRAALAELRAPEPRTDFIHTCLVQIQRLSGVIAQQTKRNTTQEVNRNFASIV